LYHKTWRSVNSDPGFSGQGIEIMGVVVYIALMKKMKDLTYIASRETEGEKKIACLVFGASTTGKTTLVNDVKRRLPVIYFDNMFNDFLVKDTDEITDKLYAKNSRITQQELVDAIHREIVKLTKTQRYGALFAGADLEIEGNVFPENFDVKRYLMTIHDEEKHWDIFNDRVLSTNYLTFPGEAVVRNMFEDVRVRNDQLLKLAKKHNIPVLESDKGASEIVMNEILQGINS
jgi:adenylate kinase family enzyme